MGIPLSAKLVLPYTRRELPAWGRIARAAGLYSDARWQGIPRQSMRCKWHGYSMEIDVSYGLDRYAYFAGRYYDLATQLFLRQAVRPGDTVLDVGANIGMVSLLASRLVGPSGRVISFEPNLAVFERLERHVASNGVSNVTLHRMGLSDEDGELQLFMPGEHDVSASFAPGDADAVPLCVSPIRRGDDVLDIPADKPVLMKMDVEGFERRALTGLENTLRTHRPPVLTECVEEHLARDGTSVADLFGLMYGHGYRAYNLRAQRRRFRDRLCLDLADGPEGLESTEVAWMHPESPLGDRVIGGRTP